MQPFVMLFWRITVAPALRMLQHLKRKYPSENIVKSVEKQKQTKLDAFAKKLACSGIISDRIADMIIKDLRPINIICGHGFQELISFL